MSGVGWIPRSDWSGLLSGLAAGAGSPRLRRHGMVERELLARVVVPLHHSRAIAVMGRKGGIGKTTVVALLGHALASLRGDRVVALDGNPDAGSLGYRVRRQTQATVTDLLRDVNGIRTWAELRAYTSQAASRLEVVASDPDPRITTALADSDYQAVIALLQRFYTLILVDTGTGVLDSAHQGLLTLVKQLLVPLSPSLDAVRTASQTLDWLQEQGHNELVAGAVVVINHAVPGSGLAYERIQQHFADRCRAVVQLPFDPHLALGAETSLEALARGTRRACLEMAAAVADGFREQRP